MKVINSIEDLNERYRASSEATIVEVADKLGICCCGDLWA